MISPKTTNLQINKQTTALIVIDKQYGYFDKRAPLLKVLGQTTDNLQQVAANIDSFVLFARETGLPIVWVRSIEDAELSPSSIADRMKAEGPPSITRPGEQTFNYFGTTRPKPGETEVTKYFYNVFPDKEIHDFLLKHEAIDTLILVGGFTSRCLLGAAFSAHSYGYKVVVAEDLMGCPDAFQGEVSAATNIMGSLLGQLTNSSELQTALG